MDICILEGITDASLKGVQGNWTEHANGSCSLVREQFPAFKRLIQAAKRGPTKKPVISKAPLNIRDSYPFYSQTPQWVSSDRLFAPVVYGGEYDLKTERFSQVIKTKGSRKDFERAKAAGEIVVKPFTAITCSIVDQPLVVDHGGSIIKTANGSALDIVPSGTKQACNRVLYKFDEQWCDKRPEANHINEWAVQGRFGIYKNATVVSSSQHHGVSASALSHDIQEWIRSEEWDQALIMSGTAELNSGIWDISTEMAELPETCRFIYGVLKKILDTYLVVRGKAKRAKRRVDLGPKEAMDDVSSLWLQWRYAVSPMIYSVNDALDYLESSAIYRTVRQGSNVSGVCPTRYGNIEISYRNRYWGKARVDPLQLKSGLKMNLISTAWEVVPLSFVLDWVFNVGDLLSVLQGPSGASEVKHTYSRRTTGVGDLTLSAGSMAVDLDFYTTTPINPLDFLSLDFAPHMNWKRVMDALAISWGITKSQFRNNT